MIQPALRPVQIPETPRPRSLAQRLEEEFAAEARPEHTASSMAERFAPEASRHARMDMRPELAEAVLADQLLLPRRLRLPGRGFVIVLTAVALAPVAILAALLWFGAVKQPGSTAGGASDVPLPAKKQAAVAPTPVLHLAPPVPEIALTAPEEIVAKAGAEIPFAIGIDADGELPARSMVAVRDLPKGATFSGGRPYGAGEWSLRTDEIAGLKLHLPKDHQPNAASDMRIELVAADGSVLAHTATRVEVTPQSPAPVARQLEADRIEALMDRGRKMIAVGYFAGARAYYGRAAEAGSGEAALAVGATYDPDFIAALGVQGIKADPEAAEKWYGRAAALGIADPEPKLALLKEDWIRAGAGEEPIEPAVVTPGATEKAEGGTPQEAAGEAPQSGPLGRLVAAASELGREDEWVEVSDSVNVREEADGTSKSLKIVQAGAKFRVLGREGNWVHIADPVTQQDGWIYTRFLKEASTP